MRVLHLFDIDGTLVHVGEEEAFAQAFLEHHGPEIDLSFDVKAPITDMGYVGSVLERHFGRPPADGEVRALLDRFVEILAARTESGELPVRAVAGASTFVPALAARAPVAVSTGCVEGSARLKLARVVLGDVFPCGAFSIGERSRADIVRRAIASAASGCAVPGRAGCSRTTPTPRKSRRRCFEPARPDGPRALGAPSPAHMRP